MSEPPHLVPVVVDLDDRQQAHHVDVSHLSDLLAATLSEQYPFGQTTTLESAGAEVGLALVGIDEMAELNERYMGGTGPTDVLAFPIDGVAEPASLPAGQPVMLGDVVICPAVAARAPQQLEDELALLVVHGALHLLGHDHAEPAETAVMKSLEASLLQRHHHGTRPARAHAATEAGGR